MAGTVDVASSGTVLDALLQALSERSEYNRNQQEAPAAILWTDENQEWSASVEVLRGLLPQFYVLGRYKPDEEEGPAIWLRCALAGKFDDVTGDVPVVYLPGLSRREFRNVESLPDLLQPLAELQFRGVFFSQENGKDWTVNAFLQSSRGGLGLEVAGDQQTRSAMVRALPELLETQVSQLEDRRLDADDFNELLTPEMTRDLLFWLNQPEEAEEAWSEERWEAFSSRCSDEYDVDPGKDGVLVVAEKFANRDGPWSEVWDRFAEAPQQYQSIPERLKRAAPDEMDLFERNESWPHINDTMEERLRSDLIGLQGVTRSDAAEKVRKLEAVHGERRSWVWSRLGAAPLAEALPHFVDLAEVSETLPHLRSLSEIQDYYANTGWKADRGVMQLLETVRSHQNVDAVSSAITALYQPWLEELAQKFQILVEAEGYPREQDHFRVAEGTCVLFADGLRLDVAERLKADLTGRGLSTEMEIGWAALPTVTSTAKPFNSPLRERLGRGDASNFTPTDDESGDPITTRRFRKLLEEMGFEIVEPFSDRPPSERGWCEVGAIDKRGHDEGWKLARRIPEEIRGLGEAVEALLERGWERVRIVTDHGWLLVPEPLEKRDLPHFLAETRWSRCALLEEGSEYSGPLQAWHWDDDVLIAFPAGARVFYNGVHYAHGGLSPQECLVPRLTVEGRSSSSNVQVDAVEWQHLRCRVRVSGPKGAVRVDLRKRAADPKTSIADRVKEVKEEKVTLFVADDEMMDEEVELVLLGPDDNVVARQRTRVGGER